jgi:UDP-N-acetylglucosamine acyltransferase
MKRRGVKPDARLELKRALKVVGDLNNKMKDLPELLGQLEQFEEVKVFADFFSDSKRSIIRR